jgi:hypothetical protein
METEKAGNLSSIFAYYNINIHVRNGIYKTKRDVDDNKRYGWNSTICDHSKLFRTRQIYLFVCKTYGLGEWVGCVTQSMCNQCNISTYSIVMNKWYNLRVSDLFVKIL